MTEQIPEPVSVSSIGQTFAAARAAQGLAIIDVERQLKLGAKQIEALEADDFSSMPGKTFARGFIRNYAKLLQIDAAPLLQAYQQRAPAETLAISAVSQQIEISTGVSKRWMLYGGAIAVGMVLVALLVYQWMQGDPPHQQPAVAAIPAAPLLPAAPSPEAAPTQPPTLHTDVAATALPESPKGMVAAPAPLAAAPSLPSPVQSPPQAVNAPKPSIVKPSQPVVAMTNSPHISFKFERESWVNVTDGTGKMIFSQLNPAGSQQDVVGTPPFSLIVGNAHGVVVTYNGKAVDLGPFTNVDVARLTLK